MTRETLSKPHGDLVIDESRQIQSDLFRLSEAVTDFLGEYRFRDVAEQTVYRYRLYLRDFDAWLNAEGRPTKMADLQGQPGYRLHRAYLAHLREERGLAPGSVATIYRVLRTFWNWAVRESQDDNGEPNNPPYVRRAPTSFFTKSDAPKDIVADDVGEPYSEAEVERLLSAIGPAKSADLEVARNRAMVLTLLASGLRRKELVGLTLADYNSESGIIKVRRSAAKQTARIDDARMTALHGEAWREVNRYVRRLRSEGFKDGPLFPSLRGGQTDYHGKPLRPDSVTQLLSRLVQRVQFECENKAEHGGDMGCSECIRNGGVHRLRNTWAINQLQKGVSPSAVKSAGGWSSYEMLDRYSRKAAGILAVEEIQRANQR